MSEKNIKQGTRLAILLIRLGSPYGPLRQTLDDLTDALLDYERVNGRPHYLDGYLPILEQNVEPTDAKPLGELNHEQQKSEPPS